MKVAITGATGFVGGAVVQRLLRRGHVVRALARNPEHAGRLRDLGGVEIVAGHLDDEAALRALMAGADAAVHLVGIIMESGSATFERIHVAGTMRVVTAARAAGVGRFVHMSALGARAEPAASAYHRTKAAGEEAVRNGGIPHAILRPSLIAGEGSAPLRMMIDLVRFSPIVPIIGDGRYLLQPVWIEDVAEAFAVAVERPEITGTFEIAGPDQLTWHQMVDLLEAALAVTRRRVSVPVGIVRFAAHAGMALPELAPISPDQLQMLIEGNTSQANAIQTVFGIRARPFGDVARELCAPYAPTGAVRKEDGPGVSPRA